MEMAEPLLFTVAEASEKISVSRMTLLRLIKSGEIPTVRIGRSVRVPAIRLNQWVDGKVSAGEAAGSSRL